MDPVGRRFFTGTFPFETLAGFNATIEYFDSIGGISALVPYERALGQRFLDGLPESVTIYGMPTMAGRVPTFLINVEGIEAVDLAAHLVGRGIGVWAGDTWYSLDLYKRLGYKDAAVRVGFVHYNTAAEVDRLLDGLASV
jgi:selenocysteine lyase/cysteine desulfurase